MKSLSIRLTVESPLAIRSDHAAAGAAGVKSIPGSTLLGSLASLYRSFFYNDPTMRDSFESLFTQDQILYPYLYPAIFADEGLQDQDTPVSPLPITASSCKRHPGFLFPKDKKNDGHGVRDTLIDWALFSLVRSSQELQRKVPQPLDILRRNKNCRCNEAMDPFEGYYRRSTIRPYPMISAKSYTRLQTHTGIHRESDTVQDGILYSRQVFEEGMQFWGEIIFPDDEQLLLQFTTFAKAIGTKGLLRMGTGRTRGMGKVSFSLHQQDEEQNSFVAYTKRLAAFNQALHKRASEFGLDTLPYSYFFALTLHSPLLLPDDLLRYQSCIDVETLQMALFPHALLDLTLLYHASAMQRINGWQELWGTPRIGESAIATGSVFLFACSSSPDAECLEALFALEERGMGKRRAEGFGRVCVSDQFHQMIEQEA